MSPIPESPPIKVTRFLVSSAESPGAVGLHNRSSLFARICWELAFPVCKDSQGAAGSSMSRRGFQSLQEHQQCKAKGVHRGWRTTRPPHFPPALLHGWKSRLRVGFSSADAFMAWPGAAASCSAIFGLDTDQTCEGGKSRAAKPGSDPQATLPTSPPWPGGPSPWHCGAFLISHPPQEQAAPSPRRGSLASISLSAGSKAHFPSG